MVNSVKPDQTAPIGAVCSGSTLFACILKLAINVIGNYLQQTTSADDILRCIYLGALKVKQFLSISLNVYFACSKSRLIETVLFG